MKKKIVLLIAILLTGLLSACMGGMTVSSEEIVTKVLSAKDSKLSYYGEGVIKLTTAGEVTENASFKEYAAEDGKRKIITTGDANGHESSVLNDGKQVISYDAGSESAFSIDLTEDSMPLLDSSPKEQLMTMLEAIKKTHDYEIVGEEKILDLNVYHIKAAPNTNSNLFGEVELWIDQKTWFVVKSISVVEETKSEFEYKLLDFSPDFKEDTFTLDIPESVTVTPIESNLEPDFGTLEDAQTELAQPFLVFTEEDMTVENVEIVNLQGIVNRPEITVYYAYEGLPSVLVSIFPTPEEAGTEIKPGEWEVRGQHADYDDFIDALSWDENGLRYTIIIQNPDLEMEAILKMTENMILNNEM
ncbi:outer membrane lipoprotein carrier protein LolA [Bacillus timonensis]|uniref:Outer membrane lipoprotein carrier protein LolA n=1 Tax=Bacillus timonensis TaxID=1033734 RepID=A0A4S3PNX7_9BACI|nr:outer membrane lipoprotein carrier protein LolA [Bacillus timonensis]THE11239.1 outer membrane lipoprotein carrier protein LolA [Bacillus timonensis]